MIGEVEFVVAPFALDEMRGEHKDAPSALLDASEDVLDDRLSRDEVALMVTHSQAVVAFELGKKLRFDPVGILLAVRYECMEHNPSKSSDFLWEVIALCLACVHFQIILMVTMAHPDDCKEG